METGEPEPAAREEGKETTPPSAAGRRGSTGETPTGRVPETRRGVPLPGGPGPAPVEAAAPQADQ